MSNEQSERLTNQQKKRKGVEGIFEKEAKSHDTKVKNVAKLVFKQLQEEYPYLKFRQRFTLTKKEINDKLKKIDSELGQTLFVQNANIQPDGGMIEVKDDHGHWRVVLVSEAKYQGKDKENIELGKQVGPHQDQDIMTAGNAIERAHKNISEIANYMLSELYFPYVIFLEGTNFLTETISVTRPDGRKVILEYNNGGLNRLDRLTAANYGMPFNQNLCKNKFIKNNSNLIMLQAVSMYTTGDGSFWSEKEMNQIMMEIAKTSLKMLSSDIFEQITKDKAHG